MACKCRALNHSSGHSVLAMTQRIDQKVRGGDRKPARLAVLSRKEGAQVGVSGVHYFSRNEEKRKKGLSADKGLLGRARQRKKRGMQQDTALPFRRENGSLGRKEV